MPRRAAVEGDKGDMERWLHFHNETVFDPVSVAVCALPYIASFEWRFLGEFLTGCRVDQGSLWLAVTGKAQKQALAIRPEPG
jgi:hypothetical protein